MAVQPTPYVETALSHSAELFRRTLQVSVLPVGSAGGVVPATAQTSANLTAGVAGCTDLIVSAPASGMSVNVDTGAVIVCGSQGSGAMGVGYTYPTITTNGASPPTIASNAKANKFYLTTQGAYYCYNDDSLGAVSLAITASDPSNPRIDVVVAQVEDSSYSGTDNDWKLAVITGTAAASPTVPVFPASSIPLALVWVPANSTNIVTADILDVRVAYNRNPFYARVTPVAGATVTGNQVAVNNWTTVVSDITGSYYTGTGNKFTCPVQGLYYASFTIFVASPGAAGQRLVAEMGATSGGLQGSDGSAYAAGIPLGSTCSGVLECKAGDIIQPLYYANATGMTIAAGSQFPFLVSLVAPF